MSPSVIVLIAAVAGSVSVLGYSYHLGRQQGVQVCEAEKLAAQLKKTTEELKLAEAISEFRQSQIGEAQAELEQRNKLNAELQAKLASLPLKQHPDCIPDSVLDSIRKFRAKSKG